MIVDPMIDPTPGMLKRWSYQRYTQGCTLYNYQEERFKREIP